MFVLIQNRSIISTHVSTRWLEPVFLFTTSLRSTRG